jgi:CYTH domain-containing protein
MADEIERKWEVEVPREMVSWGVEIESSIIEQRYLHDGRRLRRRSYSDGRTEFTETVKTKIGPGHYDEQERSISGDVYQMLLRTNPMKGVPVKKTRYTFEYDGRTWELDLFEERLNGIAVLEVELPSADGLRDPKIKPPPFITVLAERTGERWWTNKAMSIRDWSPEGPKFMAAGTVWRNGPLSFVVWSACSRTRRYTFIEPGTTEFRPFDPVILFEQGWDYDS